MARHEGGGERGGKQRDREPRSSRSSVHDEPPRSRVHDEPERSHVHDEPPLERRDRERDPSRHTLHDEDVPEVRLGRNVGEAGGYGPEGTLSDFTDETSAGHHAGYGDYGQQDYGPHGASLRQGDEYRGRHEGRRRGEERSEDRSADYGKQLESYGTRREPSRRSEWDMPASGPAAEGGGASRERRSFRGLGPKDFTRSDERLREAICEMLTDDPYVDASDISVAVSAGVVTLDGSVDDRATKYRVEERIDEVSGVREVRNQLRTPDPKTQGSVGRATPKTG